MGDKKTDQNMSEIDKALQAAKARKEAKAGNKSQVTVDDSTKATTTTAPKRPKLSDEEKAARTAKAAEERAVRAAAREEKRAAQKAAREASRQPAHMKKVLKAAERLPALSQAATLLLGEVTANYTQADLAALAAHIQHFNRTKATERSSSQKLVVGQSVTIVGGDPRFVGKTGTIAKAQRIRCYVALEGQARPAYCFTSDVVPAAAVEAPVAAGETVTA